MSEPAHGGAADPVRIVRVISRLNIGGPAIQAISLTKRLEAYGYSTVLVRGSEEPDEGNMDHLAREMGVEPVLVSSLRRNPGWHDLRALAELVRIIRRERPHIVHTHAAKGGTLGRLATLVAFPRRSTRPVVIHTYHGHSLRGYFSPRTTAVYRGIEQALGRVTDHLIAVSDEVRDELVAMHVAPAAKFDVVPLGFDLARFALSPADRIRVRAEVRDELGIPHDVQLVTLVARLVPIKRVDRFLRLALELSRDPSVWFLIVGDGELRTELHGSPEAQALSGRLVWAGFRNDMPAIYAASDLAVQTSDNEGTPVALIEAQAAGLPVVSTDVGGIRSAVADPAAVVAPDASEALAGAARSALASGVGDDAAELIAARFSRERLERDLTVVYRSARDVSRAHPDPTSDTERHDDLLARLAAQPWLRPLRSSRLVQLIGQSLRRAAFVEDGLPFLLRELAPGHRTGIYRLRDSEVRVVLRHRSRDIDIFHEVFINGRPYDLPAEVRGALAGLAQPRVLDLGANVGLFCAFVSRELPGARITAVEPDPHNLPSLRRCAAANDAQDRWTIVEACALNRAGQAGFAGGEYADSHVSDEPSELEVPAIDFFEIAPQHDLIKMDIEGSEWPILRDPRLRELRAAALVLEWHPISPDDRDGRERASRLLGEAGYAVVQASDPASVGTLWALARAA